MNEPEPPPISPELRREMIRQARYAGGENQTINEIIYDHADSWVTDFENNNGIELNNEDRQSAIEAFSDAFFDPSLADEDEKVDAQKTCAIPEAQPA
ncbi:MAG: hypothetical protein PHV34_08990 [Verrucomicrobiae bacterium]|nr:hypothetical protein [Verrucomicrobiae bacterium]